MKQTAVDWLFEELEKHYIINNGELDPTAVMELKRKAKEMEMYQIIDAQSYAISNADMTNNKGYFDCDKYYKETFKQD
jgi:hypothetical protein